MSGKFCTVVMICDCELEIISEERLDNEHVNPFNLFSFMLSIVVFTPVNAVANPNITVVVGGRTHRPKSLTLR